jgi:hypothetical protein
LDGHTALLTDKDPMQALVRIWRAMADAGVPQGYVIGPADQLAPVRRKALEELPENTPQLSEWCTHPRVRAANHIVVLLAEDLHEVHTTLRDAALKIGLNGGSLAPSVVASPGPAPVANNPAPSPAAGLDEGGFVALGEALQSAILTALVQHDETHRPSGIPVMAAVATVLGQRTGNPGTLAWTLEDGDVRVSGPGSAEFQAQWEADIVLAASASMLIKEWRQGATELNPAGLKALCKRVARML